MRDYVYEGTGTVHDTLITYFGCGEQLSPDVSAFLIARAGSLPRFVVFALAVNAGGPPGEYIETMFFD
jgi:hypothetical protein